MQCANETCLFSRCQTKYTPIRTVTVPLFFLCPLSFLLALLLCPPIPTPFCNLECYACLKTCLNLIWPANKCGSCTFDRHHLKLKHYGLFLCYVCSYEYVLGLSEWEKCCQNTQILKHRLLFTKPENNCGYCFCLYLIHLFIFIQYTSISTWTENPHHCLYPILQGAPTCLFAEIAL